MHSISRRRAFAGAALLAMGSNCAAAQTGAARQAPLAIKGYDAVAYFTDGRPLHGLPEIAYEWDEQQYRFATAEHRDLFKADPVRRTFRADDASEIEMTVPGSSYEFISRDVVTGSDGKRRLDLGFDNSNAQRMFKLKAAG